MTMAATMRRIGGLSEGLPLAAVMVMLSSMVVATAFQHDFFRPYTMVADQDLVVAYNAIRLAEGLSQQYFDHPGYGYFLILAPWYKAAAALGLIETATQSGILATAHPEAAYAQLVFAGRVLSLVLASLFALVVYGFACLVARDRLLALGAALVFASDPGLVAQAVVMRTELPALLFAVTAVAAAVAAARIGGLPGFGLLAAAGLCAVLAMMAKVQSIFVLAALPPIAFVFSIAGWDDAAGRSRAASRTAAAVHAAKRRLEQACSLTAAILGPRLRSAAAGYRMSAHQAFRNAERSYRGVLVLLLIASLSFTAPAWKSLWQAMLPFGHPDRAGLPYQPLLAAYIVAAIGLFAWQHRLNLAVATAAAAAVVIGMGVGLMANEIHYAEGNERALANFVELLTVHASSAAEIGSGQAISFTSMLDLLGDRLLATLDRFAGLDLRTKQPTRLLFWFALAGAVAALTGRRFADAAAIMVLVGATFAMELVFSLRYWAWHYLIFAAPFLVVAAAFAAARLIRRMHAPRVAGLLRAGVFVALLGLAGSNWVAAGSPLLVPAQGPENACLQMEAITVVPEIAAIFAPYCPVPVSAGG